MSGYGQYSVYGARKRNNPFESERKTSKREVFPTSELAHLWAHATQAKARNPQGNFFFEGSVLYSYRTSYPIANRIEVTPGKPVFLIRSNKYSPTTAGHISDASSAVPNDAVKFVVPNVRVNEYRSGHADNLEYFVEQAKDRLGKATRSRKHGQYDLDAAFGYQEQAKAYAEAFGIEYDTDKAFEFLPTGLRLDVLKDKLKVRKQKADAADAVRHAAQEAKWARQREIDAKTYAEKAELWRAGETVHLGYSYDMPTMLRLEGNEVVTSRGARVPASHAIALLATVRKVKARGEEFVANGHTIAIGHYRVDRIEANGTLHAGCHVILLDEIERIAPALEAWATTQATTQMLQEGVTN